METIYIRVLEQSKQDEIRIGVSFPAFREMLDDVIENIKKAYNEKFSWCGGYDKGCKEYEKRIAIVDAETFAPIAEIYNA